MNKYNKYLTRRIDKNKNLNSLLEYPSYIEIETVNACNARCPMCTINDWKRNYPVMRDNVFNKISEDLIDNKKYDADIEYEGNDIRKISYSKYYKDIAYIKQIEKKLL